MTWKGKFHCNKGSNPLITMEELAAQIQSKIDKLIAKSPWETELISQLQALLLDPQGMADSLEVKNTRSF
jgi:hypothetical protein